MIMKINIKHAALGLMAIAGITMTSCSDDEHYDVYGSKNNFIYIAPQDYSKGFNCEVMTTPAGVYGQVAASMRVQVQLPTEDSVKVSAEVNASQDLVDAYNKEHGTDYILPSQDILSGMKVLSTSGVGAKKKTSADDNIIKVQLDASKIEKFKVDDAENAKTYLIPVSLKFDGAEGPKTERPFVISQQQGIAYIVVKTSKVDDFSSISSDKVVESNIVNTPVGVFGGISANFKFKNLIAVTGDMQGTLVADNSSAPADRSGSCGRSRSGSRLVSGACATTSNRTTGPASASARTRLVPTACRPKSTTTSARSPGDSRSSVTSGRDTRKERWMRTKPASRQRSSSTERGMRTRWLPSWVCRRA